ncbi:MAG: tRNA (N6-isopentenyl adenosine(37)-C2)-methylthiotransferase MiaB [bacterium]
MTSSRTNKNIKTKRFFIKTYGCQMNFHDSGLIENSLLKKGFHKASSISGADIVILNTCSVRDHADHKIVSELGRFKKNNADKKIVLAGCFAKQIKLKKEKISGLPFDYCFGPDETASISDILALAFNEPPKEFSEAGRAGGFIADAMLENNPVHKAENGPATVKIMEGCNNYCSYCIVPYVRGREISIPLEIIHDTVKKHVLNGVKEILLLGQNVNSYLSPDGDKKNFCYLLKSISKIEGLDKITFLTSHPKDFDDELVESVCMNDKVSKSIHLPVQSGSDKILYAMNRGYERRDYLKLIGKLKKGHPGISVSSDIIVGFPGETEEDFEATLSLMDEIKFDFIFGFKYSPRPFTKALELDDDVSINVKKERLERIFKKQKEIKIASLAKQSKNIGGCQQSCL